MSPLFTESLALARCNNEFARSTYMIDTDRRIVLVDLLSAPKSVQRWYTPIFRFAVSAQAPSMSQRWA